MTQGHGNRLLLEYNVMHLWKPMPSTINSYTTRRMKAIAGIHCCNNGKRSLLEKTVTMGTKVTAASQQ
jgi:hypothetical protein